MRCSSFLSFPCSAATDFFFFVFFFIPPAAAAAAVERNRCGRFDRWSARCRQDRSGKPRGQIRLEGHACPAETLDYSEASVGGAVPTQSSIFCIFFLFYFCLSKSRMHEWRPQNSEDSSLKWPFAINDSTTRCHSFFYQNHLASYTTGAVVLTLHFRWVNYCFVFWD